MSPTRSNRLDLVAQLVEPMTSIGRGFDSHRGRPGKLFSLPGANTHSLRVLNGLILLPFVSNEILHVCTDWINLFPLLVLA